MYCMSSPEAIRTDQLIAQNITLVYQLHESKDELPDESGLVMIIRKTRYDASRISVRRTLKNSLGKESLSDYAYTLLRELPREYLDQKKEYDVKPLSLEEALDLMKDGSRLDACRVVLSSMKSLDKPKTTKDFLIAMMYIPAGLVVAAGYAIMPNSARAKLYMEGKLYEKSPQGKKHFIKLQKELKRVFDYYQK